MTSSPIMIVVRALDEAANYWSIQLGRTPRSGYLEPALKGSLAITRSERFS